MPKYRVKMRVWAYIYLTVESKNDGEAMALADERVNDDIGQFVENAEYLDVEAADCKEIDIEPTEGT